MSFVTEEITSRPQCWREAARFARDGITRGLDPGAPRDLTRPITLDDTP